MYTSLIVAGALALGVAAVSLPLLPAQAQASDHSQPGTPPAAQGQPGPGGPGGMALRPGMPGHPGMGWQGQAMMRHHWMARRMAMTPRQRCEEKLARRAGIVAYTITKLDLTAQQKPLWNRVQSAFQAAGDRARQLCVSLPSREALRQQTVLDRMNRREQALSAHLQALQQVKPAMQQFYQSLTPDQQAILNHPFRPG